MGAHKSSYSIEVLRELRDRAVRDLRSAQGVAEEQKPRARIAALDAAIASLSASTPESAEAVPTGYVQIAKPALREMLGDERMAQLEAMCVYPTAPPRPEASAPVVDKERIGQAISDHLCSLAEGGMLTLDPFDSDNIDAIVDAVAPALAPKHPSAPVGVEGRAREAVALALDEAGHHTEADNVRKGIDLDEYREALSIARNALAKQPTAAPVGVEELADAWEARAAKSHPSDAMLINKHVRELREALAQQPAACDHERSHAAPWRCAKCGHRYDQQPAAVDEVQELARWVLETVTHDEECDAMTTFDDDPEERCTCGCSEAFAKCERILAGQQQGGRDDG